MTGTATLPKAAQQFVDDAKAAGFTVTVETSDHHVSVFASKGETNGSADWDLKAQYAGLLSHERLGFRTSAPTGFSMRFRSGMVYLPTQGFIYCTSLRQVRGHIGLVIN